MKAWRWLICGFVLVGVGLARAHGFDERYDLPLPLPYVVAGACAVVLLTFLATALFARQQRDAPATRWGREFSLAPGWQRLLRGLSLALFVLSLAAALFGSRDPLMNLAPTLVWIVWWLGLSFLSALLGGVWTLLDPWRLMFEWIDLLARRLGRTQGISWGWRWPHALGCWPAVALLLLWCGLEVVAPLATSTVKLGWAALAWTLFNIAGMVAFGRAVWQANADVFARVFATLSHLAPLRLRGTAATADGDAGSVAFVIAMLATVVFDGLHSSAAWTLFETLLRTHVPRWLDTNGIVAGTLGLLAVWLVLLWAYEATARISLTLIRQPTCFALRYSPFGRPGRLMRPAAVSAPALALTLIPIALAYNVAHNFSTLVTQGQRVLPLLSDPLGLQWDLLGTARWNLELTFVDARLTWWVAVLAIVAGHMASIVWSHRVVLAAGVAPRRAAVAMLPLALLMVAYTAISLLLIAQPLSASTP